MNLNRFPIFMVHLDRFIELITFTNKIANESNLKSDMLKTTIDLSSINSKEELLESIKNQDFRVFPNEGTILNKILKESIEKEKKLNDEINSLLLKIESQNENTQGNYENIKNLKEKNSNIKASTDPNYYLRIIDEVRDLFKEELMQSESNYKDINQKVI